ARAGFDHGRSLQNDVAGLSDRDERDCGCRRLKHDLFGKPVPTFPDHGEPYPAALTLTLAPARTWPSVFTSPSAFAQMLQGLASRVSSPFEIGVRPKPIAMAFPSGQ